MRATWLTRIAVVLFAAFLVVACKPSAENEMKKWEENKTKSTEYAATYPAFKVALEEQQKIAAPEWEAATKTADEEKKAEAMQKANGTAAKVTGALGEYESTKSELKRKISRLKKAKGGFFDKGKKALVIKEAKGTMKQAEEHLAAATPANAAEAIAALKGVNGELDKAKKSVTKLTDKLDKKNKKKKKKKKDKK